MKIDLSHNLQQVRNELGRFASQVPYAASVTMNDTMKDVQKYLREVTFPRAWTQRNRAFPKAATTITQYAKKSKLTVIMEPARSKNGGVAGEGFLTRQIEGKQKVAKGKNIAVPVLGPGLKRLTGGSIPTNKKPAKNPKYFKMGNRIVERQRKKLVTRYVLTPTAKGTDPLRRFYPDAQKVMGRVFQKHWERNLMRAINTARSRSGGGASVPTSAAFSNRSL